MKLKTSLYCLCGIALFWTSLCNAAPVTSDLLTIKEVKVVKNGGFLLTFTEEVNSSCTAANINTVFVYPGQEGVSMDGVKALLAEALSAHMAGRQVRLDYNDSYAHCWTVAIYL